MTERDELVEQGTTEVHLDVRCKMCKDVGGAYCGECAAAVFAARDLWAERNRLRGAVEEIANARGPATAGRSVWMQTKAREALGAKRVDQ